MTVSSVSNLPIHPAGLGARPAQDLAEAAKTNGGVAGWFDMTAWEADTAGAAITQGPAVAGSASVADLSAHIVDALAERR